MVVNLVTHTDLILVLLIVRLDLDRPMNGVMCDGECDMYTCMCVCVCVCLLSLLSLRRSVTQNTVT